MSGIAGIYNLDGRPVAPQLLQCMTNALAHRGPDGIASWINGPVGLSHLMLHTTPESLLERQPLVLQERNLCLTLDGRVDNRKELRAALESKAIALRADTDAELVLRAYECWGEDCPTHILGDFAFAIWDARARTLYCARDPVGLRPLYYAFDGRSFSFGSELRALLEMPGFQRKVNLGMLGEYLCDAFSTLDETFYQNILRLPPGHRLKLKDGTVRITRYFHVDPHKTIRYASDGEYAEHFLEIFSEAVRCRLRSQTPVALFLSGGVDSSSILGMAAQLARTGMVERGGQLAAYHLAFSRAEADERSFVDDLGKMWNGRIYSPSAEAAPPTIPAPSGQRAPDVPGELELTPWQILYTKAKESGRRVILWGYGADEWLTGDTVHCADLLRQFRLLQLLRQFRHDVAVYRHLETNVTFADAVRWCLLPLVPHAIKDRIKRSLGWNVPSWIAPGFSKAIGLQERLIRRGTSPVFRTQVQQSMYGTLVSPYSTITHELNCQFEVDQGMEGRSPFCDRRLIEFSFALPEEQRWRDDQTKYVLRHAMRGLIPESVRLRRTKGDFTYLTGESFARQCLGETFQTLRLAAEGYVDGDAVQKLYGRYEHGDRSTVMHLWAILAAERWINAADAAVLR